MRGTYAQLARGGFGEGERVGVRGRTARAVGGSGLVFPELSGGWYLGLVKVGEAVIRPAQHAASPGPCSLAARCLEQLRQLLLADGLAHTSRLQSGLRSRSDVRLTWQISCMTAHLFTLKHSIIALGHSHFRSSYSSLKRSDCRWSYLMSRAKKPKR